MTGAQFTQWAASMGLRSDLQIGEALGIHRNSVRLYRRKGVKYRYIRLAMAALSEGLEPYGQDETTEGIEPL